MRLLLGGEMSMWSDSYGNLDTSFRAVLGSTPLSNLTRAVCYALLGAHADRVLIGAWEPDVVTKLGLQAMWAARRSGDPDVVWRVLGRASPLLRGSLFGAGTNNFDIIFGPFPRVKLELFTALHAPCDVSYWVTMVIGC